MWHMRTRMDVRFNLLALAVVMASPVITLADYPQENEGDETPARVEQRVTVVAGDPEGWLVVGGGQRGASGEQTTWAVRTRDGGATWEPALLPAVPSHEIVDLELVDGVLYGLTQWSFAGFGDVWVFRSDDAGYSWTWMASLERPHHPTLAVDMVWSDRWQGTIRQAWENVEDECWFADYISDDGGYSWQAGVAQACHEIYEVDGFGRSGVWEVTASGFHDGSDAVQALRVTEFTEELSDGTLSANRSEQSVTLRPARIASSGEYGYVREGAEVVEVTSGVQLRTLRVIEARLDTDTDGRLRASVGAQHGTPRCAGDSAVPDVAVTVWVEAADLLPVVTQEAVWEGDDGSRLVLDAGAVLERSDGGEWRYSFLEGPLGHAALSIALPDVPVTVADRFVPAAPDGVTEGGSDSSASVVSQWGTVSLLGHSIAWPAPENDGYASLLGAWDMATVSADGTTATVHDGCAHATMRLLEGFDGSGMSALGAFGSGLGSATELPSGVTLQDLERRRVATVTQAIVVGGSGGAGGFGLGMGYGSAASGPQVLGDGRICDALAGRWFELAAGEPWMLCWE